MKNNKCSLQVCNIKAQKGYYLDERYSRLFMELKELMVRRLEYLASEQIVSQEILPEYKPMCEQQKAIHMMFIKYNLTHNESIIDRLVEKMNSIKSSEVNMENRI